MTIKVIISGGSRGIGKAIARKFASEGCAIAFCGRNEASVKSLQQELQSEYSITCFGLVADLSDKNSTIDFGKKALELLGGCDVLVNNAGTYLPGTIQEESNETFEYQMSLNLNSAYYLTKTVLPALKQGRRKHIFNMCSIASKIAYPNGASYCISKFALLGFTKVLREELKQDAVAVTAVLPGATRTESWDGVDLPDSRFIQPDDIAVSIWGAFSINENSVVEELLIRPVLGDI